MLVEWKKTILRSMSSVLRPKGFRKRGTTFGHQNEDVRLLVNLQSDRGSSDAALGVAVNLGVQSFTLRRLAGVEDAYEWSVWDSVWTRRLARDASEPDMWWGVCSDEQAESVAAEIAFLLETRGVMWLEERSRTEKLYWLWRRSARGNQPSNVLTYWHLAVLKELYEPELLQPSPSEHQFLDALGVVLSPRGFSRRRTVFDRNAAECRMLVEVLSAPSQDGTFCVFVESGIQYAIEPGTAHPFTDRTRRVAEVDVSHSIRFGDMTCPRMSAFIATEQEATCAALTIGKLLLGEVLPRFESIATVPKLLRYYQDVYLPADIGNRPIWILPHMEKMLRRLLDKG